ncbi:glycosyltransferase family 4 protein [Liquorilactobacillus sicerae]|uniref:glycosyltransferase family 4 protein n=1 Tax=Liquorilactobacillus sicerae TaxID=1416943 RepID=UPI0024814D79|nr:glycosyltransferase family 4 protein [Liquorilactobacillus sicerae]
MALTEQELIDSLKSIDTIKELTDKYDFHAILLTTARIVGISPQNLMNRFSIEENDRYYLKELKDLTCHIDYFRELYSFLADDYSKKVLLNMLRYRILPMASFISNVIIHGDDQFFVRKLIKCSGKEIFVDCEDNIGKMTEIFLSDYHDYKKVYIFESAIRNLIKNQQKLKKYENLEIKSLHNISQEDDDIRRTTSLDSEVKEKVNLIKVDTLKSAIEVLIGAKEHIKNDRPKIIVCLSHVSSHLWKVPMLLKQICPNYKFYLRCYQRDHSSRIVLFAIPNNEMLKASINKVLHFYSFNGTSGKWRNVELTKEIGVVPYLLLKKYGIQQTLVTKKDKNIIYSNLKKVVPGLKIEYLSDNDDFIISEWEFVKQNYRQMDGLILRGPYPTFFPVLDLYRQLRPDGYVYLYLDANAAWMDRIDWKDHQFQKFMDQCDLITTSGRTMQEHLSVKWPKWTINYFPNGFYNFSHHNLDIKWDKKEKIILTVGRIGTYQKNNEALLQAFSEIADEIPDWSVKLVGPVEEQFKSWLEKYFACYPNLKARIILVGEIVDKGKLLTEYQRASIFALTSRLEGGTPNVIAEALTGGDCIITSGIDEAADATNQEKCGRIYHSNTELAQLLVELCTDASLRLKLEKAARMYSQDNFDFEKIVKRLHTLLFWRED